MPCSAPIITLLEPVRCRFTAPTWKKMLTLLYRVAVHYLRCSSIAA
jgi:hypothetical protein